MESNKNKVGGFGQNDFKNDGSDEEPSYRSKVSQDA
jgi:hypothetical protein